LAPGVAVEVRAIRGAPGWSDDELRTLSRAYTALWVRVRNETANRVPLSLNDAVVFDPQGTPWMGLDEAQRVLVQRWHAWSWRSFASERLSRNRMAALAARLKATELDDDWLAPGEEREGVLLFKPIPPSACPRGPARGLSSGRPMELEWRLAQAPGGEEPSHSFRMALQCEEAP
ncbi:MAG: hypothetical protein AB1515_10190, partial [Nitrospirota bacterium]